MDDIIPRDKEAENETIITLRKGAGNNDCIPPLELNNP